MATDEIRYTMSSRARNQLWDALDTYFAMLENSELAEKSKEDYYYFAERFVRWLDDGSMPGEQVH